MKRPRRVLVKEVEVTEGGHAVVPQLIWFTTPLTSEPESLDPSHSGVRLNSKNILRTLQMFLLQKYIMKTLVFIYVNIRGLPLYTTTCLI